MLPATAVHAPTRPETLHAMHVPLHALSQHTPSAQKPEAQSPPCVQDWPLEWSARHWPPLQ